MCVASCESRGTQVFHAAAVAWKEMASARKRDDSMTRQPLSPPVPCRGRNFKLRHLDAVSLLRACPDPQLLLRASTASCASGAALELDRVGMQIVVYAHGAPGRASSSGNALRCYTSEVRWGSLSPEFASIDKGALPYVAVHGTRYIYTHTLQEKEREEEEESP